MLAESVNSLFKTELVRRAGQGPWRTVDDVQLATLDWIRWWNTTRIRSYLADLSPDQFEVTYAARQTARHKTGIHNNQPAQNPT